MSTAVVPRSGILWRRIALAAGAVLAVLYAWYARDEFPHGGSPIGLSLGVAGFGLILLLAFFGIRKRSYRSTFGTLEQWLQSHIYLGVLAAFVLLLHTGGRFNDHIAVTTLAVMFVVVGSGIFGAVLYAVVPRMLTEVESNLTVAEMSEQINQQTRTMARIASGRSAPFQRIFDAMMKESSPGWLAGWRLLFASIRPRSGQADWAPLLAAVPRDEQDGLRQMLVASRQRRQLLSRLMYQQRYKNILDAWLYVHVPFTIALIVFAIVHISAVFYYGTVRWWR